MFLDLEKFKQKVSWGDSIIVIQDTLIARQSKTIESQKKDVETAKNSEKEANFKADFYAKFADKQQDLTIKILQKQNKFYAIFGVISGILLTVLITK